MHEAPHQPALSAALASLRMKQFLLLRALGEHGSMRKAADELALSQPAVSKSLLEMEWQLGVRLFERSHSGLVPTAVGSCAIEHAKSIIGALRRMKQELDGIEHNRQDIVRIGMIMGAVTGAFCEVARRACASRHGLMIEAEEGTTAELMRKLQSGELDLVFARSMQAPPTPDIVSRLLDTEPICIVAGLDHELDAHKLHSCADLFAYPWVSYHPAAPLAALLNSWFLEQLGKLPTVRLRTTSALITVATLCNSNCLAMLPSSVYRQAALAGSIRKIRTVSEFTLGDYSAFWHRQSRWLDVIDSILASSVPA
jgi:DNA-binding transcriptional LysR family regulator